MAYYIVRSYNPSLNREDEIIDTGLTLEEAQAHCKDPDTHELGVWFDGYAEGHIDKRRVVGKGIRAAFGSIDKLNERKYRD